MNIGPRTWWSVESSRIAGWILVRFPRSLAFCGTRHFVAVGVSTNRTQRFIWSQNQHTWKLLLLARRKFFPTRRCQCFCFDWSQFEQLSWGETRESPSAGNFLLLLTCQLVYNCTYVEFNLMTSEISESVRVDRLISRNWRAACMKWILCSAILKGVCTSQELRSAICLDNHWQVILTAQLHPWLIHHSIFFLNKRSGSINPMLPLKIV